MTKKNITKTTMAVSLNIEVAEKIKEIARMEERSVSQMVQRALVHYIPTIENEIREHEPSTVDHFLWPGIPVSPLSSSIPSQDFVVTK